MDDSYTHGTVTVRNKGCRGTEGKGAVMGMDLTAWLEKQHILSFYFREMEEGETIYIYDTIETRDAQNSHFGLRPTEFSDDPLSIRDHWSDV